MAISKRKLAANRANSKKSTGPNTAAGKATVAQNRTVHGLTGQFRVLSWETQDDFDYLLEQFIQAEKPADAAETELVVKMAEHTWLSKRALRMQEACFSVEPPPPGQQPRGDGQFVGIRGDLDIYVRYQAAHDRAYRRASQELIQRRKERQIAARGFESQKHAAAEATRQAEKHAQVMAIGKVRLQTEEIRAATALAGILPPDWNPNAAFPNTDPAQRKASAHLSPGQR